jgi:NADH:ubiquinone oxidoreductase subunit C
MERFSHTARKPRRPAMFHVILVLVAFVACGQGVANAQLEDVTPPTLLNFSLTPTAIDTTTSPEQVTVTVQVSDDLSGLLLVTDTCFRSPSGLQFVCGGYSELSRSGSPEVVTLEGVFTFPPFVESGSWDVFGISLTDNARNTRFFTTADLQTLGFDTQVEVVSIQDVTAPTLLHLSLTPTAIDTTTGSRQVTVTAQASDDLSGVWLVTDTCFRSPSGIQDICGGYSEVARSGVPEVVTVEGVFTFPQFVESGTWNVLGISLTDNARNTRFFTTADLQALGFATELHVVSVQDVTPPTLLDFSFTPTVIDTSTGSQQVTVTVRTSDDISRVWLVTDTCFRSPSAIQDICGGYSEIDRSGVPEVVTLQGVFTFPQFAELGTWHVLGLSLTDNARNTRFFTTDDLRGAGFPVELLNGVQTARVQIDIKPHNSRNGINPGSRGVIQVAILTTGAFDATTVDATTVRFGATGTEAPPVKSALRDVNGDGDPDLILHFKTEDTGIVCGSTSASLRGETQSGQSIEGSQSIKTLGCR